MADETVVEQEDGTQEETDGQGQGQEAKGVPADNPGDWRSHIPLEMKDDGYWKNVEGLPQLVKSYGESQRYMGSSMRVPGEGASKEDWDKVYTKLGRPEAPDKYDLTFRDFDGKFEWADTGKDWFKKVAFENGLNTSQIQGLSDSYALLMIDQATNMSSQDDEAHEALKTEFGPTYEKKVALKDRAINYLGGEELLTRVNQSELANDPHFIKAMMRLGDYLAEDQLIVGEVEGVTGVDSAQRQINEIMADRKHPYWDAQSPLHDSAIDDMHKLFQLVHNK
jgi:hypothetical protein